jgi:hypothetical protein
MVEGHVATVYFYQDKLEDAEKYARDSLSIFEKTMPNDWEVPNHKSLLGGILVERKDYTNAEPLLLEAWKGLNELKSTIPAQSRDHVSHPAINLIKLYEATSRTNQAAEWKQKLAELKKSQGNK